MHLNNMGMAAAQAAFSGECDDWLVDLCAYLTANRDFLVDFVKNENEGHQGYDPRGHVPGLAGL